MKRLAVTAVAVLACTLCLPTTASAYQWFQYWRNGTLTNGTIDFQCSVSTCASPNLRAGSGLGTNACTSDNWIPVGTYGMPFHVHNYDASLIKGRVWRLTDYQCSNGTIRTQLFVHTEETATNGQYCPTSGDDPFCWEGAGDYYSKGCIKVARMPIGSDGYSDVGRLDSWDHAWAGDLDWVSVSA